MSIEDNKLKEETNQQDNKKEEIQDQSDNKEWDFGWKFHRGPILIAAVLTVIFYLCILIFVK